MAAYVTTVASPTTAINQTISGIGFTPTCCIVIANIATVVDTVKAANYGGFGWSDGTRQWAMGWLDDDNTNDARTQRHMSDAHVAYYGGIPSSVSCQAVGSGLGPSSGQWVFNWDDPPGAAVLITYIFFDYPAYVDFKNLGTGTTEVACTTTGVDPNLVFISHICYPADPSGGLSGSAHMMSFGAATNASGSAVNRAVGHSSVEASAAANINSIMRDNAATGQMYNDGVASDWRASVTSYGTGTFGITPNSTAGSDRVGFLALDTGSQDIDLVTVNLPTTTGGAWDPHNTGWTPEFAMLFGGLHESADVNTIQTTGEPAENIWIGVTDGTNGGGGSWVSENAATVMDTAGLTPSGFMMVADADDNTEYNIPVPTFDSTGFTVTPTTAAASPTRVAFLLVIETEAGGATYNETIAEAFSFVDVDSRTAVFARTLAEALALVDVSTGAAGIARTIAEALALTDAATAAHIHARTISESLALTDSATRVAIFARLIADSLVVIDSSSGTGGEVVASTKGGQSATLAQMRRMERQQLLEMLRQDDEVIVALVADILRKGRRIN